MKEAVSIDVIQARIGGPTKVYHYVSWIKILNVSTVVRLTYLIHQAYQFCILRSIKLTSTRLFASYLISRKTKESRTHDALYSHLNDHTNSSQMLDIVDIFSSMVSHHIKLYRKKCNQKLFYMCIKRVGNI